MRFTAFNTFQAKAAGRLTVDPLVKQQEELCDRTVHLLPVEVQQGNHLEVQLPEQVGQFMNISHGCRELDVVTVVHIANQESNFVCGCCEVNRRKSRYIIMGGG